MAQSETISGTVATSNPQGIQLQGRNEWFNYSLKADPPLRRATVGEYVQLSVTRDARGTAYWINGYVEQPQTTAPPVSSAAAAAPATQASTTNGGISDRDRLMARMSALKSATALATQVPGITAGDVVQVADRFLAWLMDR